MHTLSEVLVEDRLNLPLFSLWTEASHIWRGHCRSRILIFAPAVFPFSSPQHCNCTLDFSIHGLCQPSVTFSSLCLGNLFLSAIGDWWSRSLTFKHTKGRVPLIPSKISIDQRWLPSSGFGARVGHFYWWSLPLDLPFHSGSWWVGFRMVFCAQFFLFMPCSLWCVCPVDWFYKNEILLY